MSISKSITATQGNAYSTTAPLVISSAIAVTFLVIGILAILAAQGILPQGMNVISQWGPWWGTGLGVAALVSGILTMLVIYVARHQFSSSDASDLEEGMGTLAAIESEVLQEPSLVITPEESIPNQAPAFILQWDQFCACQKVIQDPDPNAVASIELKELIQWTSDPKQQQLIQKKLKELETDQGMQIIPNWILWFLVDNPTQFKQEEHAEFKHTLTYLKGIIHLVHQEPAPQQAALKAKAIKDLCLAFEECSPTWYRQSQATYRWLSFRQQIKFQGAEDARATKIRMILMEAAADYKEEVVLCGRQLETDPKKPMWHYLSYFVEKVGEEVGMVASSDMALQFHRKAFDEDGKTNADLVRWFKNLCCADRLIDSILNKINAEFLEHQDDEGELFFLSHIRHQLPPETNIADYHDAAYRPNRLAVAFLLKEIGLIHTNPERVASVDQIAN